MEETPEIKGRDPGHPGPAMAKHGDDCFYYYNSNCTAGDACKFRHCEAALGSDMVCFLWKQGRCARPECKFRHMRIPKKKKERPCYWENKPQGCQNPQCTFSHKRPRNANAIFAASDKSVKSELGASRKRGKKRKDLGDVVNQEVFFSPPQKVFKSVKDRLTWPADAIAFSQSADTSASLAITTPNTPYSGRRVMHFEGFSRRKKMWRHENQNAGYWGLHTGETPIEEGHFAPEESPSFGAELHPTTDDAASHQSCSPPHCLNARGPPQSDHLRETAASPSTSSTSAEEQFEELLTEFAGYEQDEDVDHYLGDKPVTDLIEELVDYANQC